jgi:purine-cytosine permease-like protein
LQYSAPRNFRHFPIGPERTVDAILIIGILLLLLALLGVGGIIEALGSIAWILLIIAIIVIAWRVITGRRPV